MMPDMTAKEMELALASFFDYRRNLIVPNVGWGWFVHECDLVVVTKTGFAWEVEIKTSLSDLLRDKKKIHLHHSQRITCTYFAIPEDLMKHQHHIPEEAGIIECRKIEGDGGIICIRRRMPKRMKSQKITIEEKEKLGHLAAMRIWRLKRKIMDLEEIKP